MGNNGGGLVRPDGSPLATYKGLIVVKVPVGMKPPMQLLDAMGKATNSIVYVMPPEVDIYYGKIAKEHLENIHQLVHTALQIPMEGEGE